MGVRQEQKEQRRQEILYAALDLFVTKGYAATKISDIAERVSMSVGLLFHYFESKEKLYEELVRMGLEGTNSPGAQKYEKAIDYFTRFTEQLFFLMKEQPYIAKMFVLMANAQRSTGTPERIKEIALQVNTIEQFVPIIQVGQKEGTIRQGDPRSLSNAFWCSIQGIAEQYAVHPEMGLPKAGIQTEIYEKHTVAGGLCIGWKREGFFIDNCVHWLTGTKEGSGLNRLWKEVGVLGEDVGLYKKEKFYSAELSGDKLTFWRDKERTRKELLTDGKTIKADYVVCASDTSHTFTQLIDGSYMPKELSKIYKERELYPVVSAFHVAFGIEGSLDEAKETNVFACRPITIGSSRTERMSINNYSYEPDFAPEGKSIIQSTFVQTEEDYEYWIRLYEDKEAYHKKKTELSEEIQQRLAEKYPQLKGRVRILDVWTPATYNRYCNTWNGAYMSFIVTRKAKSRTVPGKIKGLQN